MAKMINENWNKKWLIIVAPLLFVSLWCTVSNVSGGNAQLTSPKNAGYETKYDVGKLTFEDITGSVSILNDLFSIQAEKKLMIKDKDLSLSLHTIKFNELLNYDNIPHSIITIKSNNKLARIGLSQYEPAKELSYKIPNSKTPVLAIQDTTGGNCWNCRLFHIIGLDDKYFLNNIATVTHMGDIDKDGADDFIRYDDIWEGGLGLLSHADSPGAIIILTLNEGKILPDIRHHIPYYQSEIKRLTSEINKYPKSIPPEKTRLLSRILEKFLIYRLLGDEENGWREFNKDIRHYDSDYFYLAESLRTRGVDKIPISDIIHRMKTSLEQRGSVKNK